MTPKPWGDDDGGERWCYNFNDGPVAQSVEQRIENPCVGGSIPPQATNLFITYKTPVFNATALVLWASGTVVA